MWKVVFEIPEMVQMVQFLIDSPVPENQFSLFSFLSSDWSIISKLTMLLLILLLCQSVNSDHIPEPIFAGDGFTDTEFEGSRASRLKYDRRSPAVATELHNNIRCDEVVGKHHSECYRNYERCKDTHRCNRAEVDYDVLNARLDFFERTFNGGKRFGADMVCLLF